MSGGIGGGEGEGFDLSVKGQVHGYDTAQAAVNVGANDTIIYADSTQAAGIGYGASAKSTLGVTGDILAASSANTLSAITASATSGHVLTSTGAASLPTYQASAGGVGDMLLGTVQNITAAKTFNDSIRCYFGTGNDANIYHNGSDLYIGCTTGNIWVDQNMIMASNDNLAFQIKTNQTLVSGAITLVTNVINSDTEGGAASDDFTTCNATATGKSGSLITILCSNASRTVNIIDTSGAIQFLGAGDFSLDKSQDIIMFSAIAGFTHNYEVSRSDNAA